MNDTQLIQIIKEGLARTGLSARAASLEATGRDGLVKNIFNGSQPSFANVEKLFAVLGINLTYSVNDKISDTPELVPMLGYVAAGGGDDLDDTTRAFISDDNLFDDVDGPPTMPKNNTFFCLEVRGNSMRPAYKDGDKLFFREDDPLRNQKEKLIGQNCAVRLQSNEVYVKRLARADSGNSQEFNLESLNPVWPVMINQTVIQALPVRFVACKV